MHNPAIIKYKPAILEGSSIFEEVFPILRPTLPEVAELNGRISEILASGTITNGKYVREFEGAFASYVGVREAVAVSSCTSGLMLTLKCMELKGEVIVPSFTFSATGHAIAWNNLTPVFVECGPETFNIDPKEVEKKITENTAAILAVHIFGNPCAVKDLEDIARRHNLKLIFDAAHGCGARAKGSNVGCFGDAEVFSLSPTKLVVAGEGGMITTNNDELAKRLRIGRNYGDPGTYDCEFWGMNARMAEFNAMLGICSLAMLDKNVCRRNYLANIYRSRLSCLPGICFQKIDRDNRCSYKDFTILIEEEMFGLNRDELAIALEKENIMTRKYFYPPLHKQKAYRDLASKYDSGLPITEGLCKKVLTLPMYSHMDPEDVERICKAIINIHKYASEVRASFISPLTL